MNPLAKRFPATLLVLAVLAPANAAPQNLPIKVANTARFDLTAATAVGELAEAEVTSGRATFSRPNWLPEAERSRAYTVSFPLLRFHTNEVAFAFVPRSNGAVTLTLTGPWEEVSKGVLYQQELLWDSVEVVGAVLVEGGLDRLSEPIRTWHNNPQALPLRVQAQMPVTVRVQARAVIPPGFRDMQRIAGRGTLAHLASRRFMRGANLGNYLEAPPNQNWGARYTAQDFVQIKAEGFDHVRLPVGWHHHAGPAPEFKLADEIYGKVDFLVTNALLQHLNVIVNIHHYDEFTSNPSPQAPKFFSLWRQIARHYARSPDGVAFELLNEPKDAATTLVMNPVYAEVIRQIRETNPRRTIFLGPGNWNQVSELPNLLLPDADQNLVVTLHCYDPFRFTHQGAAWTGSDTTLKGIRFPGPPEKPLIPDRSLKLSSSALDWLKRYNELPGDRNPCSPAAFRDAIQTAKEWSDYYGRPVHFGEFGCYMCADPASRARFYAEFRQALDEARIGWAIWDWKAGFRYWDERKRQPAEGMREALFPKTAASIH
jgi:endoglucanase